MKTLVNYSLEDLDLEVGDKVVQLAFPHENKDIVIREYLVEENMPKTLVTRAVDGKIGFRILKRKFGRMEYGRTFLRAQDIDEAVDAFLFEENKRCEYALKDTQDRLEWISKLQSTKRTFETKQGF
jgi:hypothetical protein